MQSLRLCTEIAHIWFAWDFQCSGSYKNGKPYLGRAIPESWSIIRIKQSGLWHSVCVATCFFMANKTPKAMEARRIFLSASFLSSVLICWGDARPFLLILLASASSAIFSWRLIGSTTAGRSKAAGLCIHIVSFCSDMILPFLSLSCSRALQSISSREILLWCFLVCWCMQLAISRTEILELGSTKTLVNVWTAKLYK